MCTRRTRYARVAGGYHEVLQLAYRYITLSRERESRGSKDPIRSNVCIGIQMRCCPYATYTYSMVYVALCAHTSTRFFFLLLSSGNDFFRLHIVFPERAYSDLSSETHGGPTAPHPPRYIL